MPWPSTVFLLPNLFEQAVAEQHTYIHMNLTGNVCASLEGKPVATSGGLYKPFLIPWPL